MQFAKENAKIIIDSYNDNKSPYQIAKELGTYPNKIRRALKYLGVELRGHSEAQKIALETGRHSHPTKGKKRSEKTKEKISDKIYEHWQNMSDEEREHRVDVAKKQWEEMSDADKNELMRLALEGVRKAGREGSKIEKNLKKRLTDAGYGVIHHKKGLIPADKLEVDLFIPELKTAIEIDGPSHFLPIWGEDNLAKHIASDAKKAGLLISHGYCLIRVKIYLKKPSKKHERDMTEILVKHLEKIRKKFPKKQDRFIEIDVT